MSSPPQTAGEQAAHTDDDYVAEILGLSQTDLKIDPAAERSTVAHPPGGASSSVDGGLLSPINNSNAARAGGQAPIPLSWAQPPTTVDEDAVDGGANAFLDHTDVGDDDDYDYYDAKARTDMYLTNNYLGTQHRLYTIIEGRPFNNRDRMLAIAVNIVVLMAILVSCVVFSVETLPSYYAKSGVQDGTNPLFWVETTCILIFIGEAATRLYCVPLQQLKNIFFVIDVISIVAYFVDLTVDVSGAGSSSALGAIRALRLMRVIRVFKLSRYSKSLQLVLAVLKSSASGLTILLVPLILAIIVFATMLYFFEQTEQRWDPEGRVWKENGSEKPAAFQTIPDAIWFCMATVTTVGYGDLIPKTIAGRLIAVMVQFIGVLTLSFPNIVLGSNLQFAFRKYHQNMARRYFGKKFRKVRHLLLFIRLAKDKVEETKRLKAEQEEMEALGEALTSQEDSEMEPSHLSDSEEQHENMSEALPAYHHTSEQNNHCYGDNASTSFSMTDKEDLTRNLGVPERGDDGKGGGEKKESVKIRRKRKTNYMLTNGDFLSVKKDDLPPVTTDNVKSWSYKEISCVTVLQRVLEGFSGVATVDDLYYAYRLESEAVAMRDLALIVIYLSEGDYLQVFSFKQYSTKMLVSLTPTATSELQLYPEEGVIECQRGADFARMVWRQTTGHNVPFTLQPLFICYPQWSGKEKNVDNGSDTLDLKTQHNTTGKKDGLTEHQKELIGSASPEATSGLLPSFLQGTFSPPQPGIWDPATNSASMPRLNLSPRALATPTFLQHAPAPTTPQQFGPPAALRSPSHGQPSVTLEEAKVQMKLLIQIQQAEVDSLKEQMAQLQQQTGSNTTGSFSNTNSSHLHLHNK